MMRDVTSMVSEAVSEGRTAVDSPLDVGIGSASEVELAKGTEEDTCTTDSIVEDALAMLEPVALEDGDPEGAAPG
jgi:hypothetical protein